MITNALKKMFGSKNDRELKRMSRIVASVNALEDSVVALTDDDLRGKTAAFREPGTESPAAPESPPA